jgi:hypothetical protein
MLDIFSEGEAFCPSYVPAKAIFNGCSDCADINLLYSSHSNTALLPFVFATPTKNHVGLLVSTTNKSTVEELQDQRCWWLPISPVRT